MTYLAGEQNGKRLMEAAQCGVTMETPEPTCQGDTAGGLGDLRLPLWARPVSAEG